MNTGRSMLFRALVPLLVVAQIIALAALGPVASSAEQPSAPITAPGRSEAGDMNPRHSYTLNGVHAVDGRQGVAWTGDGYCISGSTTLSRYDDAWNLTTTAEAPFSGFSDEVNHIGDIDVYDGKLYAGVEYFMDGEASSIQIAVYDAETLELIRTYAFDGESGQTEVSGIAVDPDSGSIWLCSWADGESGRYLYRYDLESGAYLGKHHLQPAPQWIQGIAFDDGWIYMTADDGTADLGEPDHVYRCRVDLSRTAWPVLPERTLDDVTLQGEVEGISFDRETGRMFVSYNRGAQIVLGMPKGFYQGYDREIHEVFSYDRAIWAMPTGAEAFEPVRAMVTGVDRFGDLILDLESIDLEYGDSVDLSFSGGHEIKAVPYYPDFFGKRNDAILTDYFNGICVAGISCDLSKSTGIEPGEALTITLEQRGRYRELFEAYDINDARKMMEGQTDEAFCNTREVTAGNIRVGRLYRGASPFDIEFGRVERMDSYIREHNIGAILDLADSRELLENRDDLPDHTSAMIAEGRVIACHIGVDYLDQENMKTIASGLADITDAEGPLLINCSLGRDRTGVICALLEALCGATYDEIVQDYMVSYDCLHRIDMNPDSLQYRLFKARIDEQLAAIFGVEIGDLPGVDMRPAARDYLTRCGMTEAEIDALERWLTTP